MIQAENLFNGDTRRKIAVVDDEPLVGELLTEILTGRGFAVEAFVCPREALKVLATEDYALIFCDMRMPDLHGTELYSIVKSVNPEAASRFVFLTSDASGALLERFFAVEGCLHLAKPFSGRQIREVVARFVSDSPTPPLTSHALIANRAKLQRAA